jgi:16S rRNA (guanine527-N7)-methyltransferase
MVDLGSGAGFPGLIWGMAEPERRTVLVESAGRKAAFLRQSVRALGLTRIEVRQERIESAAALAACGGRILTSRAAAAADLMLAAAAISCGDAKISVGDDLALVLYPGVADAERLRSLAPAGLHLAADAPLESGAAGRLMVWRRLFHVDPSAVW